MGSEMCIRDSPNPHPRLGSPEVGGHGSRAEAPSSSVADSEGALGPVATAGDPPGVWDLPRPCTNGDQACQAPCRGVRPRKEPAKEPTSRPTQENAAGFRRRAADQRLANAGPGNSPGGACVTLGKPTGVLPGVPQAARGITGHGLCGDGQGHGSWKQGDGARGATPGFGRHRAEDRGRGQWPPPEVQAAACRPA